MTRFLKKLEKTLKLNLKTWKTICGEFSMKFEVDGFQTYFLTHYNFKFLRVEHKRNPNDLHDFIISSENKQIIPWHL